jgi:hypothetical protein
MRSSGVGLKSVAVALLAVLLVLCLGDVAHAVLAPVGQAECAICNEQSGCGAPSVPHLALPAAILPGSAWAAAPAVLVVHAGVAAFVATSHRPVLPRSPRSPPAA